MLAFGIEQVFLTGFHSTGLAFFFEMQWFYLWLYLDFTAYSDIAIGAGRLLGVATPENFDRPYVARNMIEYWTRWHISLSLWIRRNIFTPLQLALVRRSGGQHPLRAASIAFLVSFVLCGLWHQISPGFLLWGTMHACGLIVCNLYQAFLKKKLGIKRWKKYRLDWRVRTLALLVTFEWVALSLLPIAGTGGH